MIMRERLDIVSTTWDIIQEANREWDAARLPESSEEHQINHNLLVTMAGVALNGSLDNPFRVDPVRQEIATREQQEARYAHAEKLLDAIERLNHPCGDSPCLNATCGCCATCYLDADAVQVMIDTTPEKQQMICDKIPPQRRTFVVAGTDFFMNAEEVERRMDPCIAALSALCGINYEPIDVAYNRLIDFLKMRRFIILIPKGE